ncbi:hypothetical protein [Bacillus cereus group sp. BY105LC]|uniref:hypothetical protein n=1 Tax=Bacillus cereus group sp. BY105LC TaxID=3018088 RepID=UPI0022E3F7D1|nr:hypothetical protein [Bacillus cereus group sp. BY105LC]MDA1884302.1 hypothetical protein [Bacillus cereus group sp. BY105LC]
MDEEDIKRFDEKYNKDWTIVIANYGKFFEQLDTTLKPGSILSFYFFKKIDGEYYMVSNDGGSINQVIKHGKEDVYIIQFLNFDYFKPYSLLINIKLNENNVIKKHKVFISLKNNRVV